MISINDHKYDKWLIYICIRGFGRFQWSLYKWTRATAFPEEY